MCGIIGILSDEPVALRLVEALRRLEYRGYDSAGVATLEAGGVTRVRAPGKLINLDDKVRAARLESGVGVGHTRWATHGEANEINAHPHASGRVAIVHNGIIENFRDLRLALEARGRRFDTQTDSETIAHLIDEGLTEGLTPRDALLRAVRQLKGAYALAVIVEGEEDLMMGARQGSPLVIGVGRGEMFLGSDALAVGPFTSQVIYLEEGDACVLHRGSRSIFNTAGEEVQRPVTQIDAIAAAVDKGNYRHFMLKEIHEQPDSASRTIAAYVDAIEETVGLPDRPGGGAIDLAKVDRVQIVACGTAYYAGLAAAYWFERIARVPATADIASEFRYRSPVLSPTTLCLFVSQSGETADTRAALDLCRSQGLTTAAVVNVPTSSIAREVDAVFPTLAGTEIGVASTKAFTAQLCALLSVAIALGRHRGAVSRDRERAFARSMMERPRLLSETLKLEAETADIAIDLSRARDVLYLGRGVFYPMALEGALKLKEISYIHAEGYASGELKHGPIALVDDATPVIMVAPADELLDKSLSNLEEVATRRGKVILISTADGVTSAGPSPARTLVVPDCDPLLAPILAVVPLQLLAYAVAVEKGADVDQPRNLAKSVTVE
ncbi:glutamine--fructose-6-phosphate transaminase (isomerizing) [bacterium]|nr:glutamine--fructose-6-phosphate transaminase (isomerizing) [bacterium]